LLIYSIISIGSKRLKVTILSYSSGEYTGYLPISVIYRKLFRRLDNFSHYLPNLLIDFINGPKFYHYYLFGKTWELKEPVLAKMAASSTQV
jgi:hypothetical protein